MAKAKTDAPAKLKSNPVTRYLRETRAELAKVTWPTRQEWLRLSAIVLAVTVAMSVILGLVDAVGAQLMDILIYR